MLEAALPECAGAPWPDWRATLPPAGGERRAEGGRRVASGAAQRPPPAAAGPLISYVTVVKNAAGTIGRTIDSVQAQRWPHVEHIVIDGCSTDGTLAVIERHRAAIDYYASEPDGGLYEALNKAVELASGELICVLNADDWLAADAAQTVAAHFAQPSPHAARLLCTAAWAMRSDRRKLWLPAPIDAGSWLVCANVCHNAVYATRAAYEASGPYRADLRIAADFAWLMACVDAGVEIRRLDEPTVHYSMGGLSADTRAHTTECAAILRRRFPLLDESQAWGLMHCFHQFRANLAPFSATRPAHLGRFLCRLVEQHGGDADLLRALARAGFATLRHPDDEHAAATPTRREKIARSLYKRSVQLRRWFGRRRVGPR